MKHLVSLLLPGVCILFAGSVLAQTRHVVVNGQRLSDRQIAQFDRAQCTLIPNGYYWLNAKTGAWGYAGNPVRQGWVGDYCRRTQRQRSLSERGLLYTPGDLNFR